MFSSGNSPGTSFHDICSLTNCAISIFVSGPSRVAAVGAAQNASQPSTAVPQPARKLSWSVVRPVLISHESLKKIMTPIPVTITAAYKQLISPFEQFLGCHFLLKQLPRFITNELKVQVL